MRLEIFRSKKGKKEYYFRIRATNGNILCTSEGYTRRGNAMNSAKSLRRSISVGGTPIIEV